MKREEKGEEKRCEGGGNWGGAEPMEGLAEGWKEEGVRRMRRDKRSPGTQEASTRVHQECEDKRRRNAGSQPGLQPY